MLLYSATHVLILINILLLPYRYSPLGDGSLVRDAQLSSIGAKYNKSGAQVALKWCV